MKKILVANSQGFTLTELLISVAVTGIVIFAATLVYTMSLRSIDLQLVNVEVHREARLVLNSIKKDLSQAELSTPPAPQSPIISNVNGGVFNRIDFVKVIQQLPVKQTKAIAYYQTEDKEIIKETNGQPSTICPAGVVSLSFYRPDPAGAPKMYGVKVTLKKSSRFSSKFSLEYTAKIDSIEVMN